MKVTVTLSRQELARAIQAYIEQELGDLGAITGIEPPFPDSTKFEINRKPEKEEGAEKS